MDEVLRKIKVLAVDVDGTMTDGKIIVDDNGVESKNFDVQDGFGLVLARKSGLKVAMISSRFCKASAHRAKDLGVDLLCNGVYPKTAAYEKMLKDFNAGDDAVCFVGDDVADLAVLKRAGFAVAVANAVFEIKQVADYVTKRRGGEGAVREVVELILKAQGKWGPELYGH